MQFMIYTCGFHKIDKWTTKLTTNFLLWDESKNKCYSWSV